MWIEDPLPAVDPFWISSAPWTDKSTGDRIFLAAADGNNLPVLNGHIQETGVRAITVANCLNDLQFSTFS